VRRLAGLATVALACVAPAAEARGPFDAGLIAWTQLGPSGLIARAVTSNPTCPPLTVDGAPQPMQARAPAAPPDFPVLVCEAALPGSARAAAVDRRPLALGAQVRRVVVLGDTGCRISTTQAQACNDPAEWPFARIARSAAAWRPDVVLHVGDYIYREAPCPAGNAGCAGSPSGDNWATLRADFFAPAAPLLSTAPWVFLRGNHEICARGGPAWFRLLSPLPVPAACADFTEPYRIALGPVDLLVLDSAIADDFAVTPDQVAAYRAQFEALRRLAARESWLLSHKPVYVFGHAGVRDGVEELYVDQEVLQTASENDFPAAIRLLLGGHAHLFEALTFGGARPPQITVGNSGTALDPPITTPLAGLTMAGLPVKQGMTVTRFGFVTLEAGDAGWDVVLRDVDGAPLLTCVLGADGLECP
jgi:hypothetical protein